MTAKYFDNFPLVHEYEPKQSTLRNLCVGVRFKKELLTKYNEFYPYTIKDGDTPVLVANEIYGSKDYVWLLMLANNIIDFYSQWPLSDEQFEAMIVDKYGSQQEAQSLILHYEHPAYEWTMSKESYQYLTTLYKDGWTPVYAYNYEFDKNHAKRQIRIIDPKHAPSIALEIERLLS